MSHSVAKNADKPAKMPLRQSVSILKQPVLNAEDLQRFLSSQWKAKATIAVIALQREKQLLNNMFLIKL